jgi:glycosyltransferase involved in cell wall biosynthesis
MTMFSVIMPTRNRPALFATALDSVLAQTCTDVEIIVVNDGSADETLPHYDEILKRASERVRRFSLIQRTAGHGSSYAINFGAAQARGKYLCFLDDDDCWTDSEHLDRVRRVVESRPSSAVDLHLSNQEAFFSGKLQPGPIWVEDLTPILQKKGRKPDIDGAYTVMVEDLLCSHGFCHLNTLVVRRALFEEIGGLDETIRYENDRDFYLRLIDRAQAITYSPRTSSRHNIPDSTRADNMSTALSKLGRYGFQLRVCEKAILYARDPNIRAQGRAHMGFTLKKITETLMAEKRYREASFYAGLAFAAAPTVKWGLYFMTIRLRILGAFRPGR